MTDTTLRSKRFDAQPDDRYRSILDSQTEAICRWRPDGTITFANEAYRQLKGISAEKHLRINVEAAIHPEDLNRVRASLASLGPENIHCQIENRILDAHGEVRWMSWNNRAILDDRNQVVEFQAAGHDITGRIQAEETARETERQLRLVIDALPVCIAYIRADGHYDLVNDTYEKWFDMSRDDIVGKHASDVIGKKAFAMLQPQIDIALSGKASTFEGSVPYKTAGDRYVQWSYVPNFTSEGTVHGFFSVVTDLSAQVLADRALRESEERFRRLIETSPDIILVHRDGLILYVNSAGVRQLHMDGPATLIGRQVEEFVQPTHVERARAISANARADRDQQAAFQELVMQRDDGTSFEVEATGIELVYQDQPAVQLICRDITVRKTAQAQLIQSSKLATLGEMAAGMAHELNQPLNVIRMAADNSLIMIDEDKEDDIAIHRRQFETITEQSIRMADIVDHMREFARVDDDRAALLDPFDIVRRSVAFFKEMFRTANIQLKLDLPDRQVEVIGHKILLEQIFVGLLQNASDAIQECQKKLGDEAVQGRIVITGEIDDDARAVKIKVADNGDGIPPGIIDRIFEPFVTTKPVGKGTGLGLSVGNEIVKRMNGRLAAENIGEGAVFTVELPLNNTGKA